MNHATTPPAGSAAPILTRIWDSEADGFLYPEQQAGVLPKPPSTGVCFSGGGNRALTAAAGQLRGLCLSGLIADAGYISCVSGGSWAATVFTYYCTGAANDAELLGPETPPDRITTANLGQIQKNSLAHAATEKFVHRLVWESVEAALHIVPVDEIWIRAVGKTFLERFGLFGGKPAYFSLDETTVDEIRSRNPSLSDATFVTVRDRTGDAKRPYLVINSSLIWPGAGVDNLVHFEYSPLYVGSQKRLVLFDPPNNQQGSTVTVGGGFIEPFAHGSNAPSVWPPSSGAGCAPLGGSIGCAAVQPPAQPFSLAFASGTSSAAYGQVDAILAGIPQLRKYLDQLPPREQYWPVPPASSPTGPQAGMFTFGDGGSLENYGLIALLLRGVKNIVVFINASRKLSLDYDPSDPATNPPRGSDMDGGLPPLFGVQPTHRIEPATPNNQVFATAAFTTVVKALQSAKAAGHGSSGPWGPAIAATALELVHNPWWGLKGGGTVNICWVYLDRASDWEAALQPEVAKLVADGNSGQPGRKVPFQGFPNYRTAFENGWSDLIQLSVPEVNLLADFTCWLVKDSTGAPLIAKTLRGG